MSSEWQLEHFDPERFPTASLPMHDELRMRGVQCGSDFTRYANHLVHAELPLLHQPVPRVTA